MRLRPRRRAADRDRGRRRSRSGSGGGSGSPEGGVDRARHVALEHDLVRRVTRRGRGSAPPRAAPRVYGCAGVANSSVDGRQLDDAAEVHDGDAVRDVAHDAEVVRDEDERQPELAPAGRAAGSGSAPGSRRRARRPARRRPRGAGSSRARARGRCAAAGRPRTRAGSAGRARARARRARAARRRACAGLVPEAMPWMRSGIATISPTRLRGLSEACGSWKTITRSRRSARSWRAAQPRDVLPVEADRARASARAGARCSARASTCRSRTRRRGRASRPASTVSADAVDRLQRLAASTRRSRRRPGSACARPSSSRSGGMGLPFAASAPQRRASRRRGVPELRPRALERRRLRAVRVRVARSVRGTSSRRRARSARAAGPGSSAGVWCARSRSIRGIDSSSPRV